MQQIDTAHLKRPGRQQFEIGQCLPLAGEVDGLDLRQLVDEVAILVGQSGVGKSSLINRLVPDADIVVIGLGVRPDTTLAESAGLIVPIGQWVLRTACLQNKAWQEAGLPRVPISVNVSARQLREEDFVMAARVVTGFVRE